MEGDFHVDYLLERMSKSQRSKTFVFKTETFPTESILNLDTDLDNAFIETKKGRLYLKQINSIWYRRPAKPVIDDLITGADVRLYAQAESQDALLGLWRSLNKCLWVSKPSLIRDASYKWEQLLRAHELGLIVPKTLITNRPVQARSFCHSVGKAAVKAVHRSVFSSEGRYEAVYTNPICYSDEKIDDVVFAPCIFQSYISKKIELRITVVGESVFACAIHSQKSEKTKDDWRNYDLKNTPHTPCFLPKNIREKCLKLVHSYGLNFGAIDMILTPESEYVFVELNPNGQWAWIEDLTNLPIASSLIELLFSRE